MITVGSLLDPPNTQTWDRQLDEPVRAWFAFSRWRDAAPPINYTELAEELDVTPARVGDWARDWGWKPRKAAYDRWLDARKQQARAVTEETMVREHLELAARLRAVTLEALEVLQRRMRTGESPTLSAASRAAAEAVRIERLAFSKPTEIVEEELDYSQLSEEEFDALVALQRKAHKR